MFALFKEINQIEWLTCSSLNILSCDRIKYLPLKNYKLSAKTHILYALVVCRQAHEKQNYIHQI